MTAWVALLRAVNLGARNKVPMAELRALLERDGFADVRSHIQSGNVLFAADGPREPLARRIEETIAFAFGVATTAVLRSADELRAVASSQPFGDDVSHTYVSFLADRRSTRCSPPSGARTTSTSPVATSTSATRRRPVCARLNATR